MKPTESLRTGCSPAGRWSGFEPPTQIVVAVNDRESGASGLSEQVFDFREGKQQEQALDGFPVERKSAGGELIFHTPFLLIGGELSVFPCELSPGLIELLLHRVSECARVAVVDRDFDQAALDESTLDRSGLARGEGAGGRFDPEDPHVGLLAGHGDADVEVMAAGPVEQLVGGVAPLQPERGFKDGLAAKGAGEDEPAKGKKFAHGRTMRPSSRRNKYRRGSILIEATYALTFLTGLSLILLKLAVNVTAPRQWTLQQSITDAYLTYEKAYAQRLPFADLLGGDSPWPAYPSKAESTVELGKLPGGTALVAKVIRTRTPDPNNFPLDGGNGSAATNPAGMKVWKFQSLLIYELGGREYVKSRTVVRSQ